MDQKQALADKLKEANNVLVTVSNNPSVDQLAACIGVTLALNKLGKHATAVFSGAVPSTIEFLQPEKTIEKNTDSLRDFIISLDKAKADKLRYKVEDKVVKIFITPYRTSISEKDLEFSQGDFNVDVVLALGVHSQQELDQAITAHGRILHDAVVATLNVKQGGDLGTVNWTDPSSSSLSELAVELIEALDKDIIDNQMATAFLTGIVAETKRFSNDKTTPVTMSISAELMEAGANQQLVATKLEEPPAPAPHVIDESKPHEEGAPAAASAEAPKPDDGTLEISHQEPGRFESPASINHAESSAPAAEAETPEPEHEEEPEEPLQQIHIDEHGGLHTVGEEQPEHKLPDISKASTDPNSHMHTEQHMILQPPTLATGLGASGMPESEDEEYPSGNPMSLPSPSDPVPGAPGFYSGRAGMSGGPSLPSSPVSASVASPAATPPFPSEPLIASAANPVPTPAPPMPAAAPEPPASPLTPHTVAPTVQPPSEPAPPPVATPPAVPGTPTETLSDLERDVHSPHVNGLASAPAAPAPASFAPPATQSMPPAPLASPVPAASPAAMPVAQPAATDSTMPEPASPDLASARDAVMQAIASQPQSPAFEPIKALNAQPLGDRVPHDTDVPALGEIPGTMPPQGQGGAPAVIEPTIQAPGTGQGTSGTLPPPVPPPMMPPTGP